MIPHRLQIKNFLSYGADMQTIDFNPHHLIYLSGKNGHGKSALLDAMTWAIWGVARKTTNAVKADQGLLRLGATQMVVIFDFELDSQLYRVKREFIQAAGGKPLAYLEFGMLNADGSIIALTDKTIRATQAVIEKTIRLDYESFINSAFLRQGHANEFSQKSPKDRKEILSAILGLQQFELVKRRALERVKENTHERQTLAAVHEAIGQQLQTSADLSQAMGQLSQEIAAIKKEDTLLQHEKKIVQERGIQLAQEHAASEQLAYKIEQHTLSHAEQIATFKELVKNWRMVHGQQLRLPSLEFIEKQRIEATTRITQYQKAMHDRLALQAQLLQLQQESQQRQRVIESKSAADIQQCILQLERFRFEKELNQKTIQEHALHMSHHADRIGIMNQELKALEHASISFDQMGKFQALYEKRKSSYQAFIVRGNWLKAELDALVAKKEVAHTDNPSCPLCEQNLSAARRKFLGSRFAKQETVLVHQLARITRIIARLKDIILGQHAQLEQYKKEHELIITRQKEIERLAMVQQEYEARRIALIKMQAALEQSYEKQQLEHQKKENESRQMLAHDESYQALAKELARVTTLSEAIIYDEKTHQETQRQLQAIELQRASYSQLHQESARQAERMEQVTKLAIQLKEKKLQLATLEREKKLFHELPKQLGEYRLKEQEMEQKFQLIQQRKEKAREEHGRIKTQQEMVLRLEAEQKKQQEIIDKLIKEIEDYQAIANAAGKDGIQALLIEEAIPEIEHEANTLLARLTNNQSQIFIESLRDLKRGGSKETLDINIADPSGIRPYEMFSGGEAFRIDFALRIAISKLLARRAGTALQTLIIDEGFGSQDEDGLSLIMDAIYKIQEDFEKVIIVSHLPGMKDQFPVHFVVRKGPNGSAISIVEQA